MSLWKGAATSERYTLPLKDALTSSKCEAWHAMVVDKDVCERLTKMGDKDGE